jgi:hypothetical protein
MEAIIEKRLNGQIWRELSLEQGRLEQYASREFMVQSTDGTMRGNERYFQYRVLPFGWSRSGYWFSRLVQSFWTMAKRTLGYRVLSCRRLRDCSISRPP